MLAFLLVTGQPYSFWAVPASGGIEQQLVSTGVTYANWIASMTYDRLQAQIDGCHHISELLAQPTFSL
jgi:hypothetical protein